VDADALYSETTRDIAVTVRPLFLEEQSDPDDGLFVWAYQVTIDNGGPETVQLLRRHWLITDGLGQVEETGGPGVLGEQPVLRPGETFVYTSVTPLTTPSGFMHGRYAMQVVPDGEMFDVLVPAFSLDSPHDSHSVH